MVLEDCTFPPSSIPPMKVSDVLAMGRHNDFQAKDVAKRGVSLFGGTIVFLETFVHFYSYTQYILFVGGLIRGTKEAGATQVLRNKTST